MDNQQGEFTKNIIALKNDLQEVRGIWQDQTANTYDALNENIEACAQRIWAHLVNSQNGYAALKRNYDSDDYDRYVARMAVQVEEV